MKDQEHIDDFVKRKLEETQFPFNEAYWKEAEKVLDADLARRWWRKFWLFSAPVVILSLVGVLMLWNTRDPQPETEVVQNTVVTDAEEKATMATQSVPDQDKTTQPVNPVREANEVAAQQAPQGSERVAAGKPEDVLTAGRVEEKAPVVAEKTETEKPVIPKQDARKTSNGQAVVTPWQPPVAAGDKHTTRLQEPGVDPKQTKPADAVQYPAPAVIDIKKENESAEAKSSASVRETKGGKSDPKPEPVQQPGVDGSVPVSKEKDMKQDPVKQSGQTPESVSDVQKQDVAKGESGVPTQAAAAVVSDSAAKDSVVLPQPMAIAKTDSAVATTTQADSSRGSKAPRTRGWSIHLLAGLSASQGFRNTSGNTAPLTGSLLAGFGVVKHINDKLSVRTDFILYGRGGLASRKVESSTVGGGAVTDQTTFTRMQLLQVPFMLQYRFYKGQHVSAGIAANSVLGVQHTHAVSIRDAGGTETPYTYEASGNDKAFTPVDLSIVACYGVRLPWRMHAGMRLSFGLFDMTRNDYFSNTEADRNIGVQLYLGYDLLRLK